MHTVEITEIYSHRNRISSNHLFSNFSSKNVTSTKFLPKKVRVNFRNFHKLNVMVLFHHTVVWKLQKFTFTLFWQKFRENNAFAKQVTKELISRKDFGESKFFIFSPCAYRISQLRVQFIGETITPVSLVRSKQQILQNFCNQSEEKYWEILRHFQESLNFIAIYSIFGKKILLSE